MSERKYVHVHLIADEPGDPSVGIWSQLTHIDLRLRDKHFFDAVERAEFEKAFIEFMTPWFEGTVMTKDAYDKLEDAMAQAEAAEDLL